MMRAISTTEKYDKEDNVYYQQAICPFCKEKNVMFDGEMTHKCEHFVGEAHGCGGQIFKFHKDLTNG